MAFYVYFSAPDTFNFSSVVFKHVSVNGNHWLLIFFSSRRN